MTNGSAGELLTAWATAEPSVVLCAMIGSRTRPTGSRAGPDDWSDWDFQIAATDPERFASAEWLTAAGLPPVAYVLRSGRLGSALKASAVTPRGEIDLVVIPAEALRGLVQLVAAGKHAAHPLASQALRDLAAVLAGGFRIEKGAGEFGGFYDWVVRTIPPVRMDDAAAIQAAEGFVCDYVFTRRKIDRGEFRAARRWLHLQLWEANYRLLHELRLREGRESFPDARRLELLDETRIGRGEPASADDPAALREEVESAASCQRALIAALLGSRWRWPDLPDSPSH